MLSIDTSLVPDLRQLGVKFVYTDLDDTILNIDQVRRHSENVFKPYFEQIVDNKYGELHDAGFATSPLLLWHGFYRLCFAVDLLSYTDYLPQPIPRLAGEYHESLQSKKPLIEEYADQALENLLKKGYGVTFLTNGQARHQIPKLRNAGMEGIENPPPIFLADFSWIVPYRSGFRLAMVQKPWDYAFDLALVSAQKWYANTNNDNLNPKNIAIIDDKLENVIAGMKKGMIGIYYHNGKNRHGFDVLNRIPIPLRSSFFSIDSFYQLIQ